MSRISSLFAPSNASALAPSKNREGYPAWERSLEEQYVQTLMTNTLGSTFYASQRDLIAEASDIHDKMLAKDVQFAGKALVYARNKGYMRSQPVFGLAKMACLSDETSHKVFEQTFSQVIRTPSDLSDFVVMLRSLKGGEGGRRIKRVVSNWLCEKLSEYWVIKYGSDNRSGASLSNIIRAFHPPHKDLFRYVRGHEVDLSQFPKIAAFENLKKAETETEKIAAIREGRLPHEVVTPFIVSSRAIWTELVEQMPIFALLRNLATLERHGVLGGSDDSEVREKIESVFTNSEVIEKSKILPFRFLKALDKVNTAWVAEALREALELSFKNLKDIEGRTAVFLDISSSMRGQFLQVASIFAIALMKKTRLNGRFLLFDTRVEEVKVSLRDSILSQASRIHARGGTDTAAPLRRLLSDKDRVDNIILVTDEQQNSGRPFFDELNQYRQSVNSKVNTFIVDVAPYRNALTNEDPRIHYMYGWSDKVIDYISLTSQGWGSIADAIREDGV